MLVLSTCVNVKVTEQLRTQTILWQHAFNRFLNDALWELRHHVFWVSLCADHLTRVPYVRLLSHFVSAQYNLLRV